MTHTAIAEALDGRTVDWMEKVSDDQSRNSSSGTARLKKRTRRLYPAMSALPPIADIRRLGCRCPLSATRRHSHPQQFTTLFDHLVGELQECFANR